MNRQIRTQIYSRLREKIPKPETALNYVHPFELLISVILSAQATDVGVNKATAKLYSVANTPQELLNLGTPRLKTYIKTIGLYNTKAENIIKTCRILMDRFDGEVPRTREELESLLLLLLLLLPLLPCFLNRALIKSHCFDKDIL